MQGETHGAELLAIAEQTLKDAVQPVLKGDARIACLMVASAMRMVARELAQNGTRASAINRVSSLTELPERPQVQPTMKALDELRDRIRQGLADGDTQLHLALWEVSCWAVSISRPSALVASERKLAGVPDLNPGST